MARAIKTFQKNAHGCSDITIWVINDHVSVRLETVYGGYFQES